MWLRDVEVSDGEREECELVWVPVESERAVTREFWMDGLGVE